MLLGELFGNKLHEPLYQTGNER